MPRRPRTLEEQLVAARVRLAKLELQFADQDRSMPGGLDMRCGLCHPFDCDDPDRHMGVPTYLTPLANRGCHCGADYDGRDCLCFDLEGG